MVDGVIHLFRVWIYAKISTLITVSTWILHTKCNVHYAGTLFSSFCFFLLESCFAVQCGFIWEYLLYLTKSLISCVWLCVFASAWALNKHKIHLNLQPKSIGNACGKMNLNKQKRKKNMRKWWIACSTSLWLHLFVRQSNCPTVHFQVIKRESSPSAEELKHFSSSAEYFLFVREISYFFFLQGLLISN